MRTRNEQKELLVKEKAIELLVKYGFEGFSMQKLAKVAKISPATLYIYYSDKDDLIKKLGVELGAKMSEMTLQGFNGKMSHAEGLKKQWENRSNYWLNNLKEASAYEVIRHSPHGQYVTSATAGQFRPVMEEFAKNAIKNNELRPMPFEVYWSIAYGPLYTMVKFHLEGSSKGGRPFAFSKKIMYEALDLVLKALTP
ncbi:MAG TPA: TetR/AcrR family transcriptional regulator [Cyclobacteriaceae bacterium]|nr:TetR/AcrR family transcriptional regulator [Cyclobacteriaceae bacterium]